MKKNLFFLLFILLSSCGGKNEAQNYQCQNPEVCFTSEQLEEKINFYLSRLPEMNIETYKFEKIDLANKTEFLMSISDAIDALPTEVKEAILRHNGKLILINGSVVDHPDNFDLRGVLTPVGIGTYEHASGLSRGVNAYVDCLQGDVASTAIHEWGHVYDYIFKIENGQALSDSEEYRQVHLTRNWKDYGKNFNEGFARIFAQYLINPTLLNKYEIEYFKNLFPNHQVKQFPHRLPIIQK